MTEKAALDLLRFIAASPSPYHVIRASLELLEAAGFERLEEADRWSLTPGKAYYCVRGGKTILAWRQGRGAPAEAGFRLLGAHSDSPVLKLRPNPAKSSKDAALLTTEIYGSPLLHTWLDRDLMLAGRAYYRDSSATTAFADFMLPELFVRAISLAPHLKQKDRIDGVKINLQTDLYLTLGGAEADSVETLNSRVAEKIGIEAGDLLSLDLSLADTVPPRLIGAGEDFISAPRIDNLFSAFCVLQSLVEADGAGDASRIAVIYDAEEIGSQTWTGARSNVLEGLLVRLNKSAGGDEEDLLRAKARSLFLSADMAHGEHPSFPDATDPDHVPRLNGGLAIKASGKGNYAIGHPGVAYFEAVCADAGVNLQTFAYRGDHGGGSSVGPFVSTQLGLCGVDVGAGMLAMHSIREMAGARDVAACIAAYKAFFAHEGRFIAS